MSSGGVSKNPILKQALSEEGVDTITLLNEQARIIQAQRQQLSRLNNVDRKRKIMRDLLKEIGEALAIADDTRADPVVNEFGDIKMQPEYSGAWIRFSLIAIRDAIKRIEAACDLANAGGAEKGGRPDANV